MTRLGHFSDETIAVDSVSADVELLEKLAAHGGKLCKDDMQLLIRCHARLSDIIPLLDADNKQAQSAHHRSENRPRASKKSAATVADEVQIEC